MKIQELELFTPKLEEQTKFYTQVLDLDIVEQTSTFVFFQIGYSILKLTYREVHTPYHFAINIPANQEMEALKWLKDRVKILQHENSEIQYFEFWNAYAIYFYDEDANIVELIARKTLNNNSNLPFSKKSLLEISEIGLPTTNISREYKILKRATAIPVYSGSVERFCAIGNEHGLFIVINKNLKKEWFPTNDKTESSDFGMQFNVRGKTYSLKYENEKLICFGKRL